jgi:hypothetical protein
LYKTINTAFITHSSKSLSFSCTRNMLLGEHYLKNRHTRRRFNSSMTLCHDDWQTPTDVLQYHITSSGSRTLLDFMIPNTKALQSFETQVNCLPMDTAQPCSRH